MVRKDKDRIKVYGTNHGFSSSSQQEEFIRTWLRDSAQMFKEADPTYGLQILWYPAMFHDSFHSIFAMGDTCKLIPSTTNADVCVLEGPEHLNWFRASGDPWTTKFNFLFGIIHTNYKANASSQYGGIITALIVSGMSTLMVRAYLP
ncbi:MAG: hypothetical protein ACREBR_03035 [bacterium]